MAQNERGMLPRWYFGALASAASGGILHPLDVLKVNYQTEHHNRQHLKGTSGHPVKVTFFGTSRWLVKTHGLSSLYTGMTASLLRQLMYSGTRFAIYDTAKALIDQNEGGKSASYTTRFFLAGFSGAVGAVVGSPPDLVLVRMQADVRLPKEHRRPYRNGLHGMYRVYHEEGAAKMFHGVEWNAARAASVTIGQAFFYDVFKEQLVDKTDRFCSENVDTHLTASFGAACVTALITQPMDTLKTIAMHQRSGEQLGPFATLRETSKLGYAYFFKGLKVRFLRNFPHTVMIFVFKEQLTNQFGYTP